MIVVTGGAGFIGSVLVWKLNQIGQKDILVVDQQAKNSPKWNNIQNHRFSDYLESDEFLTRFEKNDFKAKLKAVFHMGACSDTTEINREFLRKNNSGYSERIADACLGQNVYLQYASSAATYGNGELGYSDDDTLTSKLKPLNPYGQSKLDFDNWVLKKGLEKKITGFRFFNVYGPNEYHKGEMRSMIHKGFDQVQSVGKLKLFKSYRPDYADGEQKRDFVYAKDVVDVMIWFYQNQKWKGIYNLGTSHAESWNTLARALFKACGKTSNIEYIDMPGSIKNQYQYFTEAALRKLKSTGCPTTFKNLEAGIQDYAQNYLLKENPYL